MPPPAPQPIRVLVVDDSFFMRTVLAKMLQETGEISIIGQARTGQEAVDKNLLLEPDVVTLDVEMPEMDGLSALARIMETRPVPIVMLSAHTAEGTETAVKALEMGAVECVGKPSGSISINIHRVKDELLDKIRVAAKSRPRIQTPEPLTPPDTAPAGETQPACAIVAVAASTGGPKALKELLTGFPADVPAAILIVQHMPLGFTQALSRRLSSAGVLPVTEAVEDEILMAGRAYVAPAGLHLAVEGGPGEFRVRLDDTPPRNGVKPAADILMASIADAAGKYAVGIVLTGMGKDGMKGLLEMRRAGAATYAQDEATCVVYGMPKAAVENGAAQMQLPIPGIVSAVLQDLKGFAP